MNRAVLEVAASDKECLLPSVISFGAVVSIDASSTCHGLSNEFCTWQRTRSKSNEESAVLPCVHVV